jgi:ABC-type multidrug transport system fused ATPase/permease subunit
MTQTVSISISSRFFGVAIPFFGFAFYLVQKFYVRTSRQLRQLDIEAKAPLISQFLETLSGIATIRSYGLERWFEKSLFKLLDLSQTPFYLLSCAQVWLESMLGLLTSIAAIILVSITVAVRGSSTAGLLGVALTSLVNFSLELTDLVTGWASLETAMQAIWRVKMFKHSTPTERKKTTTSAENKFLKLRR